MFIKPVDKKIDTDKKILVETHIYTLIQTLLFSVYFIELLTGTIVPCLGSQLACGGF